MASVGCDIHSTPDAGAPWASSEDADPVLELPEWLDEVVPLFDPTEPPRVLTRSEAHALGYTDARIRHRVARGRWRRMLTGIYLTVPEPIADDHLDVAAKHGGAGCAVSGAAGLAAHGVPVPNVRRELVLVDSTARVRSSGRVIIRRTARLPEPVYRTSIPLAPVARCVADHVRTLTRLDDVRAVVGRVVHRRLATVAELGAELAAGPRNGSRQFRQALTEVGYGAHSAPEARAATALRRAGIGGFIQNAPVRAAGRTYEADFLWPALRAILEIDSRSHHFEPQDWRATMLRQTDLETAGYSVIHVSPAELADERRFVARVRLWLASRAAVTDPN